MSQWKRIPATMDPAHYFFPKHADTKITCWAGVGIDRDLGTLADSFPHLT